MHQIEPYDGWLKFYDSSLDDQSPFYGKEYNYDLYSETIYGYYIDPGWDFMGSETLYIKVLYVSYIEGQVVLELIGEWNDAINNDIMSFKRNIIEHFVHESITQFILIGENVLNFHGSDDCYYEEWFDEVEDGWIAMVNFQDFVLEEMRNYNIDNFINFGGSLQIANWRTMTPAAFCQLIGQLIDRRLTA
ncbi:MAG: hypothetical protein AAGA85_10215 [Bacteroidota bacterium]